MDTRKQDILQTLQSFVNQRPGFDSYNYDSRASYQSDYRPVLQAKHDFNTLFNAVMWRDSITADDILAASQSAFSGRLEIIERADSEYVAINYCTGQYFPTEYRNAACAIMASVLWAYWREDYETGDDIRKQSRREFGRGIGSRWFN